MTRMRTGWRAGIVAVTVCAALVVPAASASPALPDRCLMVPVPYPTMSWMVDGYCHTDAQMNEFRTVATCGDGEIAHGHWVRRGLHSIAQCMRLFDTRFLKAMHIETR